MNNCYAKSPGIRDARAGSGLSPEDYGSSGSAVVGSHLHSASLSGTECHPPNHPATIAVTQPPSSLPRTPIVLWFKQERLVSINCDQSLLYLEQTEFRIPILPGTIRRGCRRCILILCLWLYQDYHLTLYGVRPSGWHSERIRYTSRYRQYSTNNRSY